MPSRGQRRTQRRSSSSSQAFGMYSEVGDDFASHDDDWEYMSYNDESSTRPPPSKVRSRRNASASGRKAFAPAPQESADFSRKYTQRKAKQSRRHHVRTKLKPNAWSTCNSILKNHDLLTVSAWKDGIDTLLVFAGLFSAVLTAFIVESYTFLQPDIQSMSVNLLRDILTELRNMSSPHSPSDPGLQLPHVSPTPPAFAVRLNTMWFCSLIFSLSAASMCILVKQWLWDHSSHTGTSPRESARIRQFRVRGLKKWHIQEVVTALPGLLQWALALFFAGLVDLLWSLNLIVAAIATAFGSATLLFIVVTTVLPTFCVDSPHRSPQALEFWIVFRMVIRSVAWIILKVSVYAGLGRDSSPSHSPDHPFRRRWRDWRRRLVSILRERRSPGWRERERRIVRSQQMALDHQILVDVDALFMDDEVLEGVIMPCLNDMDSAAAADCLFDILSHRADDMVGGLPWWKPSKSGESSIAAPLRLTLSVLPRLVTSTDQERVVKVLGMLGRQCQAVPFELCYPDAKRLYKQVYGIVSVFLSSGDETIRQNAFALLHNLYTRVGAASAAALV